MPMRDVRLCIICYKAPSSARNIRYWRHRALVALHSTPMDRVPAEQIVRLGVHRLLAIQPVMRTLSRRRARSARMAKTCSVSASGARKPGM